VAAIKILMETMCSAVELLVQLTAVEHCLGLSRFVVTFRGLYLVRSKALRDFTFMKQFGKASLLFARGKSSCVTDT
jgi:hypothetical protein